MTVPLPLIEPETVTLPVLLSRRAALLLIVLLPARLPPLVTASVPAEILKRPEYVFVPARIVVPLPSWLTDPLDPEIAAEIVVLSAWLKFRVALPLPKVTPDTVSVTFVSADP